MSFSSKTSASLHAVPQASPGDNFGNPVIVGCCSWLTCKISHSDVDLNVLNSFGRGFDSIHATSDGLQKSFSVTLILKMPKYLH